MATRAFAADPARDLFIDTTSGEPATSFLCGTCAPATAVPATCHVIIDDGFNRWQRCGACGELIFTTQPVAA